VAALLQDIKDILLNLLYLKISFPVMVRILLLLKGTVLTYLAFI